jgi:hypothetical protein
VTTAVAPSVTEAAPAVLDDLGVSPEPDGTEPGAPVVEHVPVKKKGSRKR